MAPLGGSAGVSSFHYGGSGRGGETTENVSFFRGRWGTGRNWLVGGEEGRPFWRKEAGWRRRDVGKKKRARCRRVNNTHPGGDATRKHRALPKAAVTKITASFKRKRKGYSQRKEVESRRHNAGSETPFKLTSGKRGSMLTFACMRWGKGQFCREGERGGAKENEKVFS